MFYFTADPHFGHANIIDYCGRPFETTEEMDREILSRWNEVLEPGDRLYILGDFCGQRRPASYMQSYLDRISLHPENITLILGNHDNEQECRRVFRHVHKLHTVKYEGQRFVLCHYSMRTWHHNHKGTWHLYGHSHGNLPDDPKSCSIDVGVDANDFRLWSVPDIASVMATKTPVFEDHHRPTMETKQ